MRLKTKEITYTDKAGVKKTFDILYVEIKVNGLVVEVSLNTKTPLEKSLLLAEIKK